MEMDNLLTLERVFTGRLFQIPDYQRGYAWEEKQWRDLVEDLELLLEGKDHFMGTLILCPRKEHPSRTPMDEEGRTYVEFYVVDGQQRLTTIVLLLDAIRQEMEQVPTMGRLANGLREIYIAVHDRNGQPMPKLTLNRDSHGFFYNTVLGHKPGVEGPTIRSHRQLAEARAYFAQYLRGKWKELGAAYPDWLEALYAKIAQRLSLIVYPIASEADAGVVFETMNDRGRPITELDKVKNHLLYLASRLDLEVDPHLGEEINTTWTHIFEHLMAAGLGSTQHEDQLLRTHWLMAYDYRENGWAGSRSVKERFSLRGYQDRHAELLRHIQEYLDSLRSAATAYCDVHNPAHGAAFNAFRATPELHGQLVAASTKLARVGALASFLPLLLAVRLRFPEDGPSYLETVQLAERFAFRVYRWRRLRANTGISTLYRLGYGLYHGQDRSSVRDDLCRSLLYYCSDEQFVARFRREGEDWYHWSGLRYMLYEYEEHLAHAARKAVRLPWDEVVRRSEETVEHILPQHPAEAGYWTERFSPEARGRYTHDIGNLCLTSDNSQLGNKPFPEKKGQPGGQVGYVNSVVFMEKQLARYADWTEAEVLTRRQEIERWALARWHVESPPTAPAALPGGKLQMVAALAEQHGVGKEFRAILQAIEAHGLYPHPYKSCFMATPPSHHNRALFTVWPGPGKLGVGVWSGAFAQFYAVTSEEAQALLGPRAQEITSVNVDDFVARLDRFLASVPRRK